MIYLISKLAIGLLFAALVAALGGWVWAAERAAPAFRAQRREREHLLRDLLRIAGGDSSVDVAANERESDSVRRLLEVRDGRITELERLLAAARARADDAMSRIAELERGPPLSTDENEELSRLRALTAQHEQDRAREVEVEAKPVEDAEAGVLQSWRLRYFEQRVRYLESPPRAPLSLTATVGDTPAQPPMAAWRAREAEARATYLANEMRALSALEPQAEVEAFAANSDIDTLLRWRMLYLERRVAHLQDGGGADSSASVEAAERWKWRARYLEARLRHLERRPATAPLAAIAMPEAETRPAPPPAPMPTRRAKPPVLSGARNGAPDDFTLIDGVSSLQQTTLYSLGVFHFDQIAAWAPENVAWVDQYLRLGGRIVEEEWVEQAADLVRDGVGARRMHETEDA